MSEEPTDRIDIPTDGTTQAPEPQRPGHDDPLQRRVLGTLIGSQIMGSVGMSSGIAVTALLARGVSGSDSLAGLGTTFQVFGGALLAVPLASLMSARGRRVGLAVGYALAALGAVLIVAAAAVRSFAMLLLGTTLFGSATASNSATRYAATDLAAPHRVGRDLSLVVWASTIGSVIGPNLVGPGEVVADALHLPALTGSYTFAMAGFLLAIAVLLLVLRTDPLHEARRRAADTENGSARAAGTERIDAGATRRRGSLAEGARLAFTHRDALLGLIIASVGHGVMVGVMVMTPLHMQHGGAELRLIGLVISVHILGMYAFSPLTGLAVDRWGSRRVALAGAVVLLVSCAIAGSSHAGMSAGLTTGLFLLGLGWSCTMISGSTLLTEALDVTERPTVQGLSDLAMGLAGGAAGAVSGVALQLWGYPAMAALGAAFAAGLIGCMAILRRR